MNNSEKFTGNKQEHEQNPVELEKARTERHEAFREQHERADEHQGERIEDARHEALERAQSFEKQEGDSKHEHTTSPAERRADHPISKAERDASFTVTMQEVRAHMPTPSRTFSKVIHNKTVERVSEVTASTVARPNAILSGAILAFALTLAVYLIAKNMGYPLSGFETIGAFIVGWLLGVVYDFLKVMITGRK
jgi:hypothetical protein